MRDNNFYLEKIVIDKFRTISKLKFSPNRDLNIIIGENGTGKSNLLAAIKKALNFDLNGHTENKFSFDLRVENGDLYGFSMKSKFVRKDNSQIKEKKFEICRNNSQKKIYGTEDELDIWPYNLINIQHGIPDDYLLVSKPMGFSYNSNHSEKLFSVLTNSNNPQFLRRISASLFGLIKENDIREDVDTFLDSIKGYLSKFSNIEDVRLNKFYVNSEKKDSLTVKNMLLEFKVNSEWTLFDYLSDGTKRMFYLISEIAHKSHAIAKNKGFDIDIKENMNRKIILLEEPELGLYPSQLEKLLQFIREFSTQHQFIITTHSPQVLDMLNSDELDRIFKSSLKDGKTVLKRLTKAEQKKAKLYMEEEAFLSDYWRFSDLVTKKE